VEVGYEISVVEAFDVLPEIVVPARAQNAVVEIGLADPLLEAPEDRSLPADPTLSWRLPGGLRWGRRGFEASLDNVARALETSGFWRRLAFDEFRQELCWSGWGVPAEDAAWEPVDDAVLVDGRRALEVGGFERIGRELMRDVVELLGRRWKFDSLQLWIAKQKWDGVPRVEPFMAERCGADDNPYTRAVGRYLWTALAGRALHPGLQADMVPILVSGQGISKTRGIESWAPWEHAYSTLDMSLRDADLVRRMRGRVVLELAELRGLKSRDREAIKAFITERIDSHVPKYREFSAASYRRCLFVGSSNEREFLADETGNRRFLPVEVRTLTRLSAWERSQLWAEGVAIFRTQGLAWQEAEGLAPPEHEKFREHDSWEDDVRRWLLRRATHGFFTTGDALTGIGKESKDVTRADQMRMARALHALGFTAAQGMLDGEKKRYWLPPLA
jgi:predicted P-loop ATPase